MQEATRHGNRARAMLVQISPGYQRKVPKLDGAVKVPAALRLSASDTSVRAELVRDAFERVKEV